MGGNCPSNCKMAQGETKAIFKKAMEPYLPIGGAVSPQDGVWLSGR